MMDNLRELDARAQELFGRNKSWHPVRDPAACAELDGEMRQRGYYLIFLWFERKCLAQYRKENDMKEFEGEESATETEARTRAAVAALEREGNTVGGQA